MNRPETVEMVRYECGVCSMTAQMVLTEDSSAAWYDHMTNHMDPTDYQAWLWEVVPLPFSTPSTVT